jgi:hypothetical protein
MLWKGNKGKSVGDNPSNNPKVAKKSRSRLGMNAKKSAGMGAK